MVKLPVDDYEYKLDRLRQWAYEYEINNNLRPRPQPVRLLDLEKMADVTANHMQQYNDCPQEILTQVAMNRIRNLFNLEFKMRCNECGGAHNQDEISAPER